MRHKWRYRTLAFLFLTVVAMADVKVADGKWLGKVPAKDREKTNPFHDQEKCCRSGKTSLCGPLRFVSRQGGEGE